MKLSQKFTQGDRFLVARRNDGKFLYLAETFNATSPNWIDQPFFATKKRPFKDYDDPDEYFTKPFKATYYFENSDRMRQWLTGCRMVEVRMTGQYEVITPDEEQDYEN